jgi:hypothetical protein
MIKDQLLCILSIFDYIANRQGCYSKPMGIWHGLEWRCRSCCQGFQLPSLSNLSFERHQYNSVPSLVYRLANFRRAYACSGVSFILFTARYFVILCLRRTRWRVGLLKRPLRSLRTSFHAHFTWFRTIRRIRRSLRACYFVGLPRRGLKRRCRRSSACLTASPTVDFATPRSLAIFRCKAPSSALPTILPHVTGESSFR